METHPVPQNISSYEFRLVGDMTLKQFLQLAGGAVVALIIFRLPLIAIIKFPLTFIAAVTGILMAFVPINGRPFSTWLSAFVKAIYSPTEFIWNPVAPVATLPQISPIPAPVSAPPIQTLNPIPVPEVATSTPITHFTHTETTSAVVTKPEPKPEPPPTPVIVPVKTEKAAPPKTELPPVPVTPVENVPQPQFPQSVKVSTANSASVTSQVTTPTVPNILAGIVCDNNSQPLGGITVEIVDTATGIPARALRTNRLGQFQIAIPLTPGTYNVIAEKEGVVFEPVSIQVKGTIIPPILISTKTNA